MSIPFSNTEHVSHLKERVLTGRIKPPHRVYLFPIENSVAVFLSALISSLANAVLVVVASCSKKQVVRPHTRPNIALVEHAKTIWNVSEVDCPRKPMRLNAVSSLFVPEIPISISHYPSSPQPTAVRFLNSHPKLIFKSFLPVSLIGVPKSLMALRASGWIWAVCQPVIAAAFAMARICSNVCHNLFSFLSIPVRTFAFWAHPGNDGLARIPFVAALHTGVVFKRYWLHGFQYAYSRIMVNTYFYG